MCFAQPKMPTVTPAAQQAMPTVRDGNLEGVKKRQRAAGDTTDTTATSPLGVTGTATTFKPSLGAA